MTDPLALRAAAGDPDAWREIVAAYGPMLDVIAYRDFRLSPEDAADAAQETWAALLRHAGRVDADRLRGWLAVAMRSKCTDRIRRNRAYVPYSGWPEIFDQEPAHDFADDVIGALDALGPSRVAGLAETLSRQQRRALAAWSEYRSLAEIGAELGVSEGTVKSHLARARERLRRELERPQEAEPAVPAANLVTVHEAAGMLGVPPGRVRRWVRNEAIPVARGEDGRVLPAVSGVLRMRQLQARRVRRALMAEAARARDAARQARRVLAAKPPEPEPKPVPEIPERVTTFQAAEFAATSITQVVREADRGDLPYTRTRGGHRRFRRADVEAWLICRAAHRPVSPEMLAYEARRAEFIAWLETQLPDERADAA